MSDLTNPADAQLRGQQLLGLLGSFWTSMYNDNGIVAEYARARNQAELQSFRDLMELVACTSRFTVPIYHRQNWGVLTIRKSQQLAGTLLKYGTSGIVLGNNPGNSGVIYSYGVSPDKTFTFSNTSKLSDVSVIVNRISEPSVTLTKGIDFQIDTTAGTIEFRDNPFNNSLNLSYPIYDANGIQTDTELQLWLFMADYDWGFVYEQFGYALNLYMSKSSENYRTMLNTVWDAILQGSTASHLELLLATLADVPLVIETSEIVEDIYTESERKLVLTDKHIYKLSLTSTVIVSVGQKLRAGDRLTDAFTIYLPYRDTLPSTTIPALAIGPSLLLGPYQNDLVFKNANVKLRSSTDHNGRTRVEWDLGGLDSDQKLFWNTVHTNGTTVGATSLAQLLDLRYPPAQSPDPTAVNLPLTINPLDFLAKNVIRNNASIVVFNTQSFGGEALGTNSPKSFSQIIPAHSMIFILVQVNVSDIIAMTGAGNITTPGYTETVTGGTFMAPDPLSETSPHSFIGTETFAFSQIP